MGFDNMDVLAVIAAAAAAVTLAVVWYGVIFARAWSGVPGRGIAPARTNGPRYLSTLALFMYSAVALSYFVGGLSVGQAFEAGVVAGFGLGACGIAVAHVCQHRVGALSWVDGGFYAAAIILMSITVAGLS